MRQHVLNISQNYIAYYPLITEIKFMKYQQFIMKKKEFTVYENI